MSSVKNRMPQISIIVPVYNVEPYIEKCLDSILNQTFTDFELILIDDGATDRSGAICDEYAQRDTRVIVIHQTNQGVSAARNKGLDVAAGEYIGFVDPDDFIEQDMYEFLYNSLNDHFADISICGVYLDYPGGEQRKYSYKEMTIILNSKEAIECMLRNDPFGGFLPNRLYKRKLFKSLYLDEKIALCEDVLIGVDLFDRAKAVVYLSGAKYHYLQSGESCTTKGFSEKQMTGILAMQAVIKIIQNKYPELLSLAKYSLFRIRVDCALAILKNTAFQNYTRELMSLKKGIIRDFFYNLKSLNIRDFVKVIIILLPVFISNKLVRFLSLILKIKGKYFFRSCKKESTHGGTL